MATENINDILGTGGSKNQNKSNSEIGNNRYPALRTIAGIYMLFACIVGVLTLGIAIYFMSGNNGGMVALISIVIGAIIVLGLAAASESIKVFLDIEYNTRKSSENKQ